MLIVDRAAFLAYLDGVLLDRRADGSMIVGDDVAHEDAERALERGEKIGFSVGGHFVSTARLIDEAYVEEAING